jgi:hypothetical protein
VTDAFKLRLSALVGRSFLPGDDGLWHEIRVLLEALRPLGFAFEDAKEAQPRPVSEKVREAIKRNDIYIGVLSRRAPMIQSEKLLARLRGIDKWAPPGWVVQESGYALGCGKPVVLLIESGVDFPTANLDADTEWITFDRRSVAQIAPKLTAMMNHFIAARLPAIPPPPSDRVVADVAPQDSEKETRVETPQFSDVMAILEQGKTAEADAAFERLRPTLPHDALSEWLPYFYLYQKAKRGIAAAVDELRKKSLADRDDIHALLELERYYSHFRNYKEIIQIFSEGMETRSRLVRRRLQHRLARLYASDGNQKEALQMAATLCEDAESPGELADSYRTLGDIAKMSSTPDLETAALETALLHDPGNQNDRFRLAYLYGELGKHRLAVYHYKLRLSQGQHAVGLNNLAVSYAELKLPALEVDALTRAELDSLLARANLANACIDRGFLKRGTELAESVLAQSTDENERLRATAALQRTASIRRAESESEEKITAGARAESAFRALYSTAYISTEHPLIDGVFRTPYGDMALSRDGDKVTGELTETVDEGLALPGFPLGGTRERQRTTRFEIALKGRAGTLRVTTGESGAGVQLLSFRDTKVISGLAIIDVGGDSWEVLEEAEEGARMYTATRVG